ncbi:hypothetical protein [Paenibacillus apis]|nr:hypothetical protein [Paenibacillus apis]
MGNSDYVSFNEAMCVHPASKPIFDDRFIQLRAEGHQSSVESYKKIVIAPLKPLFQNHYLMHQQKPSLALLPVMYQAIELHLSMLAEDNSVTKYIKNHAHLSEAELVKQLISVFPALGYGDLQYIELIRQVRKA